MTLSNSRTSFMSRSELANRRKGILDRVSDDAHEASGRASVTDAVVEHERHLGDLARDDRAVHDPRPVEDAAEPEDRHLGMIDDRGTAVDAEAAVVVQGEGPRSEFRS